MANAGKRVIVITGASSGIGATLAELLGRNGHTVVLVARRADKLAEVAGRIGPLATVIAADVTKRADVERVARETIATHGHIDVWVNNAGQGMSRMPSEITDEDLDAMIDVNIRSVLYGMQAVLPHFKERNAGQIINISSMLGRIPFATIRSAYIGAKHFVNALTATLRAELAESHPGIRVTLVSPGVVRTEFGNNAVHGGPDSRQIPNSQSAEEVADVIANVIEHPRDDVYTRAGAAATVANYYATVGQDP